jgi:hypothetical protein
MRDALLNKRALALFALLAIIALALRGRAGPGEQTPAAPAPLEPDASISLAPAPSEEGSAGREADRGPLRLPSESELMRAAHLALEPEPARALALIATADQRFGDRHEERRVLEIEALVRLQRIGLSHARAAAFYRGFPRSAYRADVERLTGYHPRPPGHE